ncbi:tetratricopeptide repeat protein [Prevotella pallens]|uniref:tetratricopeptide repeat protein n=1 Tax=Prevotella pallens TaxID=60133 RepID=UPI001CB04F94|nr:tetratricopeptide repeat protein [Prevotella pallens]MBF1497849.1 tetratricopeptide repeat protein [Prevotella pallens]
MKKIILAVMMLIGTSTAFAGDSEPLKAILKAQNYAEAANLVQSTLDQLAGNEEKAKAYNRLYELAMKKVNYEEGIQLENETQKQMGKEGNKPVDEKGLYAAVGAAFNSGVEAIKYDNMPNQKGKVKPKYAALVESVYKLRNDLINGGVYYQGKDDKMAYKYLAEYVESAGYPEFASFKGQDQNLPEIAYFAAVYAYQNNDFAKAEKYIEYAKDNKERAKEVQNLKLAILGSQLKTREDSIAYANKLAEIYTQDPSNEAILSTLASTYNSLGMGDKAMQIIDAHLAKDPKSYSALVLKGQFESVRKNYDAAVDALKKALPLATDESAQIAINASIGQCLFYKAQERVMAVKNLTKEARAQFNVVYNEAISYLEKAKALDTAKQSKNLWAIPLYGSYYFVKGPEAPETKALAVDAGYAE